MADSDTGLAGRARRAEPGAARAAGRVSGAPARARKSKPPVAPAVPAVAPEQLVVRADESPWTAAELAEVRHELDDEVGRFSNEIAGAEGDIADLLRDSGEGAGDDQADTGTKTSEREQEMSLANNTRDMLLQAERAVQRIDLGTYGKCESCGNAIGKLRLQAFPRATLCMTCKQREERR